MATIDEANARKAQAVRPGAKNEDRILSDVLARSFWDDPVMSWILPEQHSRYQRMRMFFRAELASTRSRGEVLTTEDYSGAALWLPPKQWRLPISGMAKEAPRLVLSIRTRLIAALKLNDLMEKEHPKEPHWYLAVIGTDPVRQGVGAGRALITDVTDRCDREGLPAYLESSKERNVPYYERFKFQVTGEIKVPDGPVLYKMWREPQVPETD